MVNFESIKGLFSTYLRTSVTVQQHSREIKRLAKRERGMKTDLAYIRGQIDIMVPQLNKLAGGPPISSSASPQKLTDLGCEIAVEIDAKTLVTTYEEQLKSAMSYSEISSAYDLQEACFQVAQDQLQKILPTEALNTMKQVAYDRGMQVSVIHQVLAFVLRDHLTDDGHDK